MVWCKQGKHRDPKKHPGDNSTGKHARPGWTGHPRELSAKHPGKNQSQTAFRPHATRIWDFFDATRHHQQHSKRVKHNRSKRVDATSPRANLAKPQPRFPKNPNNNFSRALPRHGFRPLQHLLTRLQDPWARQKVPPWMRPHFPHQMPGSLAKNPGKLPKLPEKLPRAPVHQPESRVRRRWEVLGIYWGELRAASVLWESIC